MCDLLGEYEYENLNTVVRRLAQILLNFVIIEGALLDLGAPLSQNLRVKRHVRVVAHRGDGTARHRHCRGRARTSTILRGSNGSAGCRHVIFSGVHPS